MAILKVKSFAIEASLGKSLSKTNTKYSDICQWLLKRPVKRRASVLRLTPIFSDIMSFSWCFYHKDFYLAQFD